MSYDIGNVDITGFILWRSSQMSFAKERALQPIDKRFVLKIYCPGPSLGVIYV